MQYYYAEIDENNICVGVSQLAGKVNKKELIEIDSYNVSLLGQTYKNGIFIKTTKKSE